VILRWSPALLADFEHSWQSLDAFFPLGLALGGRAENFSVESNAVLQ
jgi:hypothetical protein